MNEWTTEDVRTEFVHSESFGAIPEREAVFDAWLTAHDAEVRAKALEDLADEAERNIDGSTETWLMPRFSVQMVRAYARAQAERGES